jgi:MOSC domain-containing protein YiiM
MKGDIVSLIFSDCNIPAIEHAIIEQSFECRLCWSGKRTIDADRWYKKIESKASAGIYLISSLR